MCFLLACFFQAGFIWFICFSLGGSVRKVIRVSKVLFWKPILPNLSHFLFIYLFFQVDLTPLTQLNLNFFNFTRYFLTQLIKKIKNQEIKGDGRTTHKSLRGAGPPLRVSRWLIHPWNQLGVAQPPPTGFTGWLKQPHFFFLIYNLILLLLYYSNNPNIVSTFFSPQYSQFWV